MKVDIFIADNLIKNSYCEFTCDELFINEIDRLIVLSRSFFSKKINYKKQFSFDKIMSGYRTIGDEYSNETKLYDLKESFSYREKDFLLLKERMNNNDFYKQLRKVQMLFDNLAQEFICQLQLSFDSKTLFPTNINSWLQVNKYVYHKNDDRDFLLEEHDDANIITLTTSTNHGLELKNSHSHKYFPYLNERNKLLVISGKLLTLLTGSQIKPQLHRVRNCKTSMNRISIMYFVHPNERNYIEPWVKNSSNSNIDIAMESLNSPVLHGLPRL